MDKNGVNAPLQWDTIKLFSNRTYTCVMKFLNEANPNSITNITNEILAEQQSHIICFEPLGANLIVQRTDKDTTFEVGLSSKWKTGSNSSGNLNITLMHQAGVKNGSCSPGVEDIKVVYPLVVY